MPRLKTDFSKTVIYKIVCNDLEVKDLYVGHTTHFTNRKSSHKTRCSNENDKRYNLKVYQTIREHGGWNNYSMVEVEKFPCKDGNEALARERYWFEQLEAKLNTYSPTLNVENRKENHKEYIKEHAEEIKEYKKQYYKEHAEDLKEKSKKYKEDHREERNQKQRERRAKKRAESQ
jgi:hypothetical protein